MCGIAGYVNSKVFVREGQIEKMTQKLSHRGPDHQGIYTDENVSLGHRRLSIIDLSKEANQPMTSTDGRYVMVYNGEIYNFSEIAHSLKGRVNLSSDTAVLLQSFVEKGERFMDELNGMFAMCIYDKVSGKLHLWRDRIGIKPLYYYYDGKDFAFASELKALLQLNVSKIINKKALQDYFFLEYIPEPLSIYEHIFKLEKGHQLTWTNGQLKKSCYYDLLDQLEKKELKSEKECLEELKSEIQRSVQLRMIADVPVGAFLSGGTDSSVICSTYQELAKNSINTYTIGFDVAQFDESEYAEKVANILETNHHHQRISANDSIELVKDIYSKFDEPFAVSSVIPMLQLCRNASQEVKVALSGDGGDELFMGYGYYNWHKRIKKIKQLSGKTGINALKWWLDKGSPRAKRAGRVLDYPAEESLWLHIWSQEQYMFNEVEISELLDTSYHHTTILQDWKKIAQCDTGELTKISLFDIRHYLANNLLHKVDISSMANGLEVRVPFLDHHLVEYAINLLENLKVKGSEQKYLLKKILEEKLPNELVYRKKWGFPAPVEQWLKSDLAYLIDVYLSEDVIREQGIFNAAFVNRLVKEFKSGISYHYKRIWALISFQMWMEQEGKDQRSINF